MGVNLVQAAAAGTTQPEPGQGSWVRSLEAGGGVLCRPRRPPVCPALQVLLPAGRPACPAGPRPAERLVPAAAAQKLRPRGQSGLEGNRACWASGSPQGLKPGGKGALSQGPLGAAGVDAGPGLSDRCPPQASLLWGTVTLYFAVDSEVGGHAQNPPSLSHPLPSMLLWGSLERTQCPLLGHCCPKGRWPAWS